MHVHVASIYFAFFDLHGFYCHLVLTAETSSTISGHLIQCDVCLQPKAVMMQDMRRAAPAEPFDCCLLAVRRPTLLHKADAVCTFIEHTLV